MDGVSRFLLAQKSTYEDALREIKAGKKTSHWMWFIFPQIKGLGRSEVSQFYELRDIDEADDYLQNPTLQKRLYEMCDALLKLDTNDPCEVFGCVDAAKLQACMTLFRCVEWDGPYKAVLDKFFNGESHKETIEILLYMLGECEDG